MQPEPQKSITSRSLAENLEYFRLGAAIGVIGFAIVAFSSFAMPMEPPTLTTLILWGISLPLGTGLLAVILGEWGVALMAGIMEFLG